MSDIELDSQMLNSNINIYRKSYAVSDIGDSSEVDMLIYSDISCMIQPKVSDLIYAIEGNEFTQTHICYLNKGTLDIKPNDTVKDTETDINYSVISIDEFKTVNDPTTVHHIRLSLEALGENGINIETGSIASAKIHIHK